MSGFFLFILLKFRLINVTLPDDHYLRVLIRKKKKKNYQTKDQCSEQYAHH